MVIAPQEGPYHALAYQVFFPQTTEQLTREKTLNGFLPDTQKQDVPVKLKTEVDLQHLTKEHAQYSHEDNMTAPHPLS